MAPGFLSRNTFCCSQRHPIPVAAAARVDLLTSEPLWLLLPLHDARVCNAFWELRCALRDSLLKAIALSRLSSEAFIQMCKGGCVQREAEGVKALLCYLSLIKLLPRQSLVD